MPWSEKRLSTSGSFRALRKASLSLAMTGAGVPLRATAPNQTPASTPLMPSSASVGTSGSWGERLAAAMARGLIFLPAISGAVVMTGSNIMSTCPAITSCSAGAEPL